MTVISSRLGESVTLLLRLCGGAGAQIAWRFAGSLYQKARTLLSDSAYFALEIGPTTTTTTTTKPKSTVDSAKGKKEWVVSSCNC